MNYPCLITKRPFGWISFSERRKNGFFIEVGADDGEATSNTLLAEIKRNWTGLLIEPNPERFGLLLDKHRRAFSINSCISIDKRISRVDFILTPFVGGIKGLEESQELKYFRDQSSDKINAKVQCFPLYALLLAIGNPSVDVFSLDVEAAELPVLKMIPFEEVDIKVFIIEVAHSDEKALDEFMLENGYTKHAKTPFKYDRVYVRNDQLKLLSKFL